MYSWGGLSKRAVCVYVHHTGMYMHSALGESLQCWWSPPGSDVDRSLERTAATHDAAVSDLKCESCIDTGRPSTVCMWDLCKHAHPHYILLLVVVSLDLDCSKASCVFCNVKNDGLSDRLGR